MNTSLATLQEMCVVSESTLAGCLPRSNTRRVQPMFCCLWILSDPGMFSSATTALLGIGSHPIRSRHTLALAGQQVCYLLLLLTFVSTKHHPCNECHTHAIVSPSLTTFGRHFAWLKSCKQSTDATLHKAEALKLMRTGKSLLTLTSWTKSFGISVHVEWCLQSRQVV